MENYNSFKEKLLEKFPKLSFEKLYHKETDLYEVNIYGDYEKKVLQEAIGKLIVELFYSVDFYDFWVDINPTN